MPMKKPNLKDIPTQGHKESFAGQAQKIQQDNAEKVRRSYSISKENDEKIQQLAVRMTQERNKSVSASEALRLIIDAYEVRA